MHHLLKQVLTGINTVAIGNWVIDFGKLPDGAYLFDINNGQITNFTAYTDADIAGMGLQLFSSIVGANYNPESDYTGGARLWQAGNIFVGLNVAIVPAGQVMAGVQILHNNEKGGFGLFFGAEGAATLGWENFAVEVKNVGGVDYKRDAWDWRAAASNKFGGSTSSGTIDRTSFSANYGATIQKNTSTVNGVPVITESYSVGWEALGIQFNFDSRGNITDIRFGVDTGVSVAIFFGLEVSLQAGGIYVFE